MLKDFSKRLFTSSGFILATGCLIIFAHHDWFQYVVALAVSLLGMAAVAEYAKLAQEKGGKLPVPWLLGAAFCLIFSFYTSAAERSFYIAPLFVLFLALMLFFALHFRDKEGVIIDLALSSFGLVYVAVPMGMVLAILYIPQQDGRWWLAYFLFVTKISDVGAYLAGSFWGKRKLASQVSPGKTVEGALFGFLCAILSSFGFHLMSEAIGAVHFRLGTTEWFFLGAFLGIIGPFSDLAESLLKRDANKKDSSGLPGLGGVLDAVDSLLFTAPFIYLYLYTFKI